MTNFEKCVEISKDMKKSLVESGNLPHLCPMVFPEKDGVIYGVVSAPDVEKEQAFRAAAILRAAFADTLTMTYDAHMHREMPLKGETIEDAKKDFRDRFPPGSMQKMAEAGACEARLITEVLVCQRIDSDTKMIMVNIPYYHEKGTDVIIWESGLEIEDGKEGQRIEGNLANALRRIMTEQRMDVQNVMKHLGEIFPDYSEERKTFHTARGVFRFLEEHFKYSVKDLITEKHPEWMD